VGKLERQIIGIDQAAFERLQNLLIMHDAVGILKAIISSPAALALLGLAVGYVLSGKTEAVVDVNVCLSKCGPFDIACIAKCYAEHAGKFYT
jgi:hypothetical protein